MEEDGASARVVHVRGEVLGQVVGAREALAARLAVVGPLARVDAQVARQVALAAERAPAEQAHERPLARVLAHVQLQVLLRTHALPAEWARELPLLVSLSLVVAHEAEKAGVGAGAFVLEAVRARLVLRTVRHGADAGERNGNTPSFLRSGVVVSLALALGTGSAAFH